MIDASLLSTTGCPRASPSRSSSDWPWSPRRWRRPWRSRSHAAPPSTTIRATTSSTRPQPRISGARRCSRRARRLAALRGRLGDFDTVLVVAVALLAVGTLDDRIGLNIGVRVLAEVGAAAVLFYSGFGWSMFGGEVANLLLTILFVLAVVNAFNLMDNLDGATTTIALISALAIAVFAAVHGHEPRRDAAVALAGACAPAFPYNLALRPGARIFLGDGGSMAIGMTLAGLR